MTEMHRQISSSESQYNTLSLEFSQYKIKAAAALGKVSTNALESRIKQLSDHIHKIETINHEKALEIEILEKKCTDFAETINIRDKEQLNLEETVSKLYAEMYQIESLKNDILVLNKRIETQSNIHRQEISKMETIHFDQIQNTKQGFKNTIADLEEKIKIKTEENLTLNAISEV